MLASLLQGWGGRGREGSMEVDKRKECVCGGGGGERTKRVTATCLR